MLILLGQNGRNQQESQLRFTSITHFPADFVFFDYVFQISGNKNADTKKRFINDSFEMTH